MQLTGFAAKAIAMSQFHDPQEAIKYATDIIEVGSIS